MNAVPPATPRTGPDETADALARERRIETLGASLSTLRIFLLLSVQGYLLLGFAFIFVRPPAAAFYVAVIVLGINTLLFAGCLLRFFMLRKQMLRVSGAREGAGKTA